MAKTIEQIKLQKSLWAKQAKPWLRESRRAYMKVWRAGNKERIKLMQQRWNDEHRELRNQRNRQWGLRNKGKIAAKAKRWAMENKEHKKMTNRRRQEMLKRLVVKAYGGICSCCAEENIKFLTIDHTKRDGKQHRSTGINVYFDLIKRGFPKEGYALLCMNCNWATRFGDPCPHLTSLRRFLNLETSLAN